MVVFRANLVGVLLLALCSFAVVSSARAAELTATTATFSSVFASAQGGDTILLAAGDYGVFTGALKTGIVTIKPQTGAAVLMSPRFNPASNITLDGLTLTDVLMDDSRTKDITIRNSTFTDYVVLRTDSLVNANILLDTNDHAAWTPCSSCGEGRVFLPGRNEDQPCGITIQNSRFGPGGFADGIQNGANGLRILNNEFVGIKQHPTDSTFHTDSIQLYGSKNTVIRGNWFHDVSVAIGAFDGADHETIEDNIFAVVGDDSPFAVTLGSDNGSVIRHNTFLDHGLCAYGLRCGILALGHKPEDPPSQGTMIKDNIITEISQFEVGQQEDFNLLTAVAGTGANDLFGQPTYVGGANPTTRTGFQLAAGSLGKGDASDGLDRGVRFSPPLPVPGDYDGNGAINGLDYDTWRALFGQSVAPGSGADGNGDGFVDAADYVVWRANLGSGSAAAFPVPEPSVFNSVITLCVSLIARSWWPDAVRQQHDRLREQFGRR